MDFLFELLFELVAERTIELSKSIKVPKYIRYPLIGILAFFCITVIGIVLITGFISLKENLLLGCIIICIAIFMLVMGILKFKKTYLKRKYKE